MRRIWLVLLVGALVPWNASGQTSGSSQPSTAVNGKTQDSANKPSGQASDKSSVSASTSASAQADQGSASVASGTTFEAVLSGPVDARKNKEGDQVVARTTRDVKSDGKVVIPKGSKLVGHVTQAKARAKGESESALGIVFEKAILKNGQEIPLNVAIQALAAAQTAASGSPAEGEVVESASGMGSAAGSGHASGHGSGGGLVSGVGSTAGAAAGTVTNTAGAVGNTAGAAAGSTVNTATSASSGAKGANATGMLNSSSAGVIGLKGLSLNSEAANATQGSLIVSSTKNVHLDSGTRMLLRAQQSQ